MFAADFPKPWNPKITNEVPDSSRSTTSELIKVVEPLSSFMNKQKKSKGEDVLVNEALAFRRVFEAFLVQSLFLNDLPVFLLKFLLG